MYNEGLFPSSLLTKISAIICVHSRDKHLKDAIKSLVNQSLKPTEYEIIIVNNGSSNKVATVISSFQDVANIRVLQEKNEGLSLARNTGWIAAESDVVAFLDDDAIASPDWLSNILTVFNEGKSISVVGGPVLPIWESSPPKWINESLIGYLSIVDWGSKRIELDEDKWLVGTNIAYKKTHVSECGGFHPGLGRQGNSLGLHEETFLNEKIRAAGYKIVYDPTIVVQHHIQKDRLSEEWFYKVSFEDGRSLFRLDSLENEDFDVAIQGKKEEQLDIADAIIKSVSNEGLTINNACLLLRWIGYSSELFSNKNSYRPVHDSLKKSKEKEKELLDLQKDYKKKSEELASLLQDLEQEKLQLDSTKKELDSTKKELDAINEKLDQRICELDSLQKELAKQARESKKLQTDLSEELRKILQLQNLLHTANDELDHTYQSYSYRLGMALTYVPRAIRRYIRKLQKH